MTPPRRPTRPPFTPVVLALALSAAPAAARAQAASAAQPASQPAPAPATTPPRPAGPTRPYGTLLYATRVGELGFTVALLPLTHGLATGVHYLEVDGMLSKVLLLLGNIVAAQEKANETWTTQYVSLDPADYAGFGLGIDAWTPQLGGRVSGVRIDLYHRWALLPKGMSLPFLGSIGVSALGWDDILPTGQTAPANTPIGLHAFGIMVRAMAPLGHYFELSATYRYVFTSPSNLLSASLTANLGDSFYARATGMFMGNLGVVVGAGVRL